MKTRLLKISMLIAGLLFVFTATSWADSGRKNYRKHGPEKRIHAKHQDGGVYHRPVYHRDNHKILRHHKFYHRKKWVNKHRQYHRNKWIRKHRRHHRNKWIRKHHRYYRQHRHYSDTSYDNYDDNAAYNELSIAATFSEPGVEFSIGTKRTW